jgi:BirA family biotin operon repressor/biotin-[acetyl-CoA-carboxylase] ligase
LSTEVWPEGYDRLLFGEVDSTMAEARRIAGDLVHPTWIFARRQTAARGRRGRVWENPPGNFAATLVMRPGGGAAAAALRSFLAANAVFESLARHADRSALSLKWPNDVLLNGGKVAGILLESTGTGAEVDWLAIGIGVNLIHSPRGVAGAAFPPVSLLEETGSRVDALDFLFTLADCYATQEAIFDRLGFQQIRESWLENAARLGEVITARTGREEITGRFETVDEAGQLVLSTSRGIVRIPAADVYF